MILPLMPFSPLTGPFGPYVAPPTPPPPIPPNPPVFKAVALPLPTNAVVVIPTQSGTAEIPPYAQTTQLDGVAYVLAFTWNSRAGVWTCAVSTVAGLLVADGIPVRNGIPLALWARTRVGFPQGLLLALPVDNNATDAGQSELGARVLLAYLQAGK